MFQNTRIGRLILDNISDKSSEKTASVRFSTADASKISDGLVKISSLPYKEDAYKSVQEIMKIAADCLKDMCSVLESTTAKKNELEKRAYVRSLIDSMIDNGMVDEADLEDKVASLSNKSLRDLEIVKEAMELAKGASGRGLFAEIEKTSDDHSSHSEKKGMFDTVIDEQ